MRFFWNRNDEQKSSRSGLQSLDKLCEGNFVGFGAERKFLNFQYESNCDLMQTQLEDSTGVPLIVLSLDAYLQIESFCGTFLLEFDIFGFGTSKL